THEGAPCSSTAGAAMTSSARRNAGGSEMCTSVMRTPLLYTGNRKPPWQRTPSASAPRRVGLRASLPPHDGVLAYQGIQPPQAWHTRERGLAAVTEPVPRSGDDVAQCRGDQDFAGAREGGNPRADVHGHARHVFFRGAAHLHLARMNAHPHLDAEDADGADDGVCARDRCSRAAEGRDESVSGRGD